MTYVGQMYGTMKNLDKALEWYKKTIEVNYIDYLAHWLLADIYKMQGKIDSAVNEVTIAMILNRNNPRLKEFQLEIYKLAKVNQADWCFAPQVEISKVNDQVKVAFDANWIGYAMAKALWKYEPGYKQSMGVQDSIYSSLEDKECLLVLMAGLINAKTNLKKYPELSTL
jgi:tetratricopeptide (TPR) repeat protein